MRFDTILAQYLYQKKKLNLPGIGTFEAGASFSSSDEHRGSLDGITFKNTQVSKADDDLIDFIKEQTGKMKPLAISDLESYLTLGKQFLYIGKPFYLEGIGTLSFGKKGFDFIPGEYVTTKLDDPNLERSESKKKALTEEDRVANESTNNAVKKFFLVIGILAGLALIGWAGYYFYSMSGSANSDEIVLTDSTASQQDTSANTTSSAMLDSLVEPSNTPPATTPEPSPAVSATEGSYKYIAETTYDKTRALSRFAKLKSYGQKVYLETSDSVSFRLFYILPSTSADTLRIKDSINRAYYGLNQPMRVKIANQ